MADQAQAQPIAESAVTQGEPMPSSQQTPPVSPQVETKTDETLPENVSDRTKTEFEKLRTQLREERERRMRLERVYQQVTPQPSNNRSPDYFNPETGEVDVYKLDSRLGQVSNEAQSALSAAKRIIAENDRKQEKFAYKHHPELDPKSETFNDDFHQAVVGYLATQFAAGKDLTLKQAADRVKSFTKVEVNKAKKQGAEEARTALTEKEQASLEVTGRSDRGNRVDLDELRNRTRYGDKDAIAARLKSIPIVGR